MDIVPIEINEKIVLSLHPYYVRNICNISKSNKFGACTYRALQKWVYPEKTISELQQLIPVLYFNDVVYLALVYNPIPESKLFFDSLTLFYHACRSGQPYPEIYCGNTNREFETAVYIAYKFNRLDVLERISEKGSWYKIFVNILRVKLGLNIIYPVEQYEGVISNFINMYPLFTFEEIVEFVIIYKGVVYPNIQDEEFWYYCYLLTDDNELLNDMGESDDDFKYVAHQVGINKVRELFHKFDSINIGERTEYPEHDFIKIGRFGLSVREANGSLIYVNSVTLHNNPHLVPLYIPTDKLGMYYITSGNFTAYINWLRSNGRNNIQLDNKFHGINQFKSASLDAELVNITFGATESIPAQHQLLETSSAIYYSPLRKE